METNIKRYIKNSYDLNKIKINNTKDIIKEIEKKEAMFDSKYPPTTNKRIDSLGKQEYDISFYTGTGGNIYLYWRQYLFHNKSSKFLNKFKDALETNLKILNYIKSENDSNSFFFGDTGIYLFCCIYGIETKNKKYFIEYFNKLIDLKNLSNNMELELELLYGISGYLYSLLFLKKYLLSFKHLMTFQKEENQLNNIIKELFFEIIGKGIKCMKNYKWNKCLLYPFPLNDQYETLYLGAAHGLIGVIYMLLCCIKIYPKLLSCENNDISSFIKQNYGSLENFLIINLNYIKSLQNESTGNFPDDVEGNDKVCDKVHFCHGCVGAVHLFLLAHELFPSNNFDLVAKKCNKCLWEKGILYKGNGLCHGISGTCYALIKLYTHYKDDLYLREAIAMASATFDPKVQSLVSEYVDPQRKAKGIPDTPFSLMEGDGGLLIMYYDLISLINGDKDVMTKIFPGYEIY